MCTVTIVPKGKDDFVLTSNRDEAPNRVSSVPDVYTANGVEILYPKDELSGGTWVGVSEQKRVVCVLNGGFEIHKRQSEYRLSRGVMAKALMATEDIVAMVTSYNFDNIEPFTVVIADWNTTLKFYELVWDGKESHFTELPLEPKIWSSVTLYNAQMRAERLEWFNAYKAKTPLTGEALLEFHKTAGGDNLDYGVVMNRGFVKTTSITQIEKQSTAVKMRYESIQNHIITTNTFNVPSIVND